MRSEFTAGMEGQTVAALDAVAVPTQSPYFLVNARSGSPLFAPPVRVLPSRRPHAPFRSHWRPHSIKVSRWPVDDDETRTPFVHWFTGGAVVASSRYFRDHPRGRYTEGSTPKSSESRKNWIEDSDLYGLRGHRHNLRVPVTLHRAVSAPAGSLPATPHSTADRTSPNTFHPCHR